MKRVVLFILVGLGLLCIGVVIGALFGYSLGWTGFQIRTQEVGHEEVAKATLSAYQVEIGATATAQLIEELANIATEAAAKEEGVQTLQAEVEQAKNTATQVAINELATPVFMPTWTSEPSPTLGPSPTLPSTSTPVPMPTIDKESRILNFDDEEQIRNEVVSALGVLYSNVVSTNSCPGGEVYDVAVVDGAPGGPECVGKLVEANSDVCIVGYARQEIDEENLFAAAGGVEFYFIYKPNAEMVAKAVAKCLEN